MVVGPKWRWLYKPPTSIPTGPHQLGPQEAAQVYCSNEATPTAEIADTMKCLKNIKAPSEEDPQGEIYKHATDVIAPWLE